MNDPNLVANWNGVNVIVPVQEISDAIQLFEKKRQDILTHEYGEYRQKVADDLAQKINALSDFVNCVRK